MKRLRRLLPILFAVIPICAQVPEFLSVGPFPVASTRFVSATYGAGKFVAVSTNAIAYSSDEGATWTGAKNYPSILYTAVLFGGDRFVAVGVGQQIAVSSDGINWSPVSLPSSYTFVRLAYGDNMFAVAGNARGFSTDGHTWSLAAGNDSAVAFANGKFLFSNDIQGVPTTASYGGETYTGGISPSTLVATTNAFVCSGGYSIFGPSNVRTLGGTFSSADGTSWGANIAPSVFFQLFQVQGAILQLKHWLMGGLPEFNTMFGPTPYPPGFVFAFHDPTLLCFGQGSVAKYASGNWMPFPVLPPVSLKSAAKGGEVFVAVGSTNSAGVAIPQILVAPNGLPAATLIAPPSGAGLLTSIKYADGKFVATGMNGAIIRSTDGTNWTRRLSNTASDLYDLAFGNGLWVAVGDAGKIVTSSDASVFNLRSSGTELPIFGITFGAGQFVAVGKDGLIVNSANGIDWSSTGAEETLDLYSVAYGNGRFVTVGTNGIVHVSTNAIQWQSTTIPNVTAFRRVAFGNGYFVALPRTNNVIFASTDGLTWTSSQIGDATLLGLDFSDGELWLTGEKSSIWRTSLSAAFAPTVAASLDANKNFVLSLRAQAAGRYDIESASTMTSPAWSFLTTISNIDTSATWTDTNAAQPAKFYRARRQ